MTDEKAGVVLKGTEWTFLSNHATVLLCIAKEPGIRVREVAARVGITVRAVLRIVDDLEGAGYLTRVREGRRNRYHVHAERPFRHPVAAHRDVNELLELILEVGGKDESGPIDGASPSSEGLAGPPEDSSPDQITPPQTGTQLETGAG